MHRAIALLALITACSEYDLSAKDDDNASPDEEEPLPDDTGESPTDTADPVEEECNGVDDDGDGEIDEGFEDTDNDGIADCVDDECATDSASAGDVTINEDCLAPDIEVADPWNVNIEWQWSTGSGSSGAIVMPAVGNLTDDNGDGVVNADDNPDIVFTTWGDNRLVALHGDGSGEIFNLSGFDGNAGVAIADVDNDGAPEVIAADLSKRVVSVSGSGVKEWTSANSYAWQYYPQPTVADLEGDGDVEVIFDIAVVEGSSGAHVTTLSGVSSSWRAPVVADVDADGVQEILLGEHCFSPTGAIEFSVPRSLDSTFAAVADIDGDVGGETFWVTGAQLHIVDDDGSLIRTVALNSSSSRPGPPSVADFDGDGDVEIVVPASRQIEMFEVDGTRNWQASIQDYSGIAGASGYDVNADGAYEVLYADEAQLRIFDGATGTVLYDNASHSSSTLWEYPVIADVDGDESAEIVIASNGSVWKGVTVLGHAGDGWAKSGATWGLHDFAVTNINPDGSIPSPAPLSWSVYNVFRARPTVDDAAVDLAVEIVDVCFNGCTDDSDVQVSVQVSNLGGVDTADDLLVALYRVDAGVETLVEVRSLPTAVAAGRALDSLTFDVTLGDFGSEGIVVRVDDDGSTAGTQNECDEDNNYAVYTEVPC